MRFSRHPVRAILLVLVLVVTTSFASVAWQIVRYGNQANDSQADAAVVLGAAAWGNNPSPVYRERINEAISLYQRGRVRYLVFTGGSPESDYPSEGKVGREFAIKHGVPSGSILVESTSRNTWQNLANAQTLMAPYEIRTVLLVSDPLHMFRAMAMATDLGLKATPSPTPSSRFLSVTSRGKFLWRETCLYLNYLLLRNPS